MRSSRLKATSFLAVLVVMLGMSAQAKAGLTQHLTVDLLTDAGARIDGASVDGRAGYSVSDAGDVNGDGIDDVVVGDPEADGDGRERPGSAYVIFGPDMPATVDLDNLGDSGFSIEGASGCQSPVFCFGDRAGVSVSGAGDVNGDGLDDVIVGADFADRNGRQDSGAAYVVFGRESTDPVDLADFEMPGNMEGFSMDGAAGCQDPVFCQGDYVRISVSGAGDVNGDGLDDVIVGARLVDNDNGVRAGSAYVVFGKTSDEAVDLALLGESGFSIEGASPGAGAGRSVSDAGDVNGDGLDDVAVSSWGAGHNGRERSGSAYVVFGKSGDNESVDLSDLGGGGYRIDGAEAFDYAGTSIAGAGDANGDGTPDLIVAAPYAEDGLGSAYVVFGKSGDNESVDLSDLGGGGYQIWGIGRHEVAWVGDINDDDLDDVIVGLPETGFNGRRGSGTAYVIYGKSSTETIYLWSLEEERKGFLIGGASPRDGAGRSIAGAGDVNGDGAPDVIVGAPYADNNGRESSGSAYIVYGCRSLEFAYDPDSLEATAGEPVEPLQPTISGADIRDVTFTVSPALPEGLTLDSETGVISGTPELPRYRTTHSVTMIEAGSCSVSTEITIRVDSSPSDPGDPVDLPSRVNVRIDGIDIGDYAGFSVSDAGDVNGDGRSDAIVGAPYADRNDRDGSGSAYVVFGQESETMVDLDDFEQQGFAIDGAATGDNAGYSVSGAGDINEDGLDDVIVGAPYADKNDRRDSGSAYIIYGKSDNTDTVDLGSLGDRGFRIDGVSPGDQSGLSVSGASDVNGDGLNDVVVGSPWADNNERSNSGSAYIVFGQSDNNETVDLSELGEEGLRIDGAEGCDNPPDCFGDFAGLSVSGAGDVNGDGRGDLIVGAPGADNNGYLSGSAYVVYGNLSNGDVNLSQLGLGGFRIDGAEGAPDCPIPGACYGDLAGLSVSDAGDVNGDGLDDVAVGAPYADANGRLNSGSAYIIYGKLSSEDVNLSRLGSGGFSLGGGAGCEPPPFCQGDQTGWSVSGVGDLNGGGKPDVFVGAPGADNNERVDSGSAYAVYGERSTGIANLNDLGESGFPIDGAATYDQAGYSVSGAGDFNGDGHPDAIVGAPQADNNDRENSGSAYIIYGFPGPSEGVPSQKERKTAGGRSEGCTDVIYENTLEVPREARLGDLVKDRGVKARVSASEESFVKVKFEVEGKNARLLGLYGRKSRTKSKVVAQRKVRVGKGSRDVYLSSRGRVRKLIKRALRSKRAPERMRLKVSLTAHAVGERPRKALNTQTVVALKRGKVRTDTYKKVRRVDDVTLCKRQLEARVKGPTRTKLTSLVTSEGKAGRGVKVKVSCSQDCTAWVGAKLWGRYEIGLKFREKGKRVKRWITRRKVKIKGGEPRTITLKGVKSKRLRKLLLRGVKRNRYGSVKLNYVVDARTKDGKGGSGNDASGMPLRFK